MKKNSETPNETGQDKPHSADMQDGESAAAECAPGSRVTPGQEATGFVPLVSELNEEIDHLYGKLHGLNEALRESDDRARLLEEKGQVIAQLHGEVKEKSSEISQLQNDIEGLHVSQRDHAQRTSELLDEKQEEIVQLAEKVSERDQEISRLHGHVEEKGLVINHLTEHLGQKDKEIVNLQGDLEDRVQIIARMQDKLGELDAALTESKERTEKLLEENQEQISRLEWKVKEKYKEITQLHGKIHDLGEELRSSEERAEQLAQDKVQITAELEGRITGKEQEITGLNEHGEVMAQEIANLSALVNEQVLTISGLERQVSGLQNTLRVAEEQAELQLEEKRQDIAGLHGQIQELNTALHASEEQAAQQLAEKGEEIARLVADLDDKGQAVVQLRVSSSEKDEAISGLEESIQQLNMSMRTVEEQAAQQLESKQKEITGLEWSVKDKNSEISQLHGNIHDLSAELSSSQEQAERQLEAESHEIDQLGIRIQQLEEEKRDITERAELVLQEKLKLVNQLEARVEHLDSALGDSKASAVQQLEEKAQVIKENSKAISQLEKQLQEQAAATSASVETSAQELQVRTEEISQLGGQLEQKTQEVNELHGKIRDIGAELDANEVRNGKLVEEHEQVVAQLNTEIKQQATTLYETAEHAKQQQEEQAREISQLKGELDQQADAIDGNTEKLAGELEEKLDIISQISAKLDKKDQEISELNSKLHDMNARLGEDRASIAWKNKENSRVVSELKAQLNQEAVTMRESAKHAEQQLKEKDKALAEKTQHIARLEEQFREMEAAAQVAANKIELPNEKDSRPDMPDGEVDEQSGLDSGLQVQVGSAESSSDNDATSRQNQREVVKLEGKEIARLQQHIQELKVGLRDKVGHDQPKKQEKMQNPTTANNTIKTMMEDKLKKLSTLDMMTGMINRQYFMKVLDESVSSDNTEDADQSVLYILLDNFRDIRERVGVSDSDEVLRNVAGTIQTSLGKRDIVSRFGYYVFTVLRYRDDAMSVHEFAEQIMHKLEDDVFSGGEHSVKIRASIGICEASKGGHNAESLIQRADLACEVARSSEDARIYIHNAAVEEQLAPEHEAESHMMVRKTLQDERFYLVYQPIVGVGEDRQQRYEVLLRVLDENGEVILPNQFLEVANSIGLSDEIDIWVIENAFRKLGELQRQDQDATFYIKVSEKTIADRELALWMDAKLNECKLQRGSVVIEIAEAAVLDDMENSMAFVTAMHNLGCKVALEHFGASSPPQVLKRLPVDILKVNGGLITSMAGNKETQITVKTIIELARNLGMECVAEQVEDNAVLALLRQYGVQLVQGNFVQIPGKSLDYNFEASIAGNESGSYVV